MKKFNFLLALFMSFVLILTFAACQHADKDTTGDTNNGQIQDDGDDIQPSDGEDNGDNTQNSDEGNSNATTTPDHTAIPTKPDDTTLEFWITQDVSSVDFSEYYEVLGWFGAREFYGKGYYPEEFDEDGMPKYCVTYLVGAYPDEADGGQFITRIHITDPNITVYGLTCNSSLDDFDETMKELGYTISEDLAVMHTATLGKVRFVLVSSESGNRLSIYVEVTNESGIIY